MSFNFSNKPLVSIACIAYNQSNYIQEALDGFLMQKTNFPIEIIIHDDASTDGTAEIIRKYEEKFPDIIKPIYQVENQYTKGEGILIPFVYPKCNGKYIALCEGDDYWTDPYKLQKQVDFLETHQDYGLVHTDCDFFIQHQNKFVKKANLNHIDLNAIQTKLDLFVLLCESKVRICTATVIFKRALLSDIPSNHLTFSMGDTPFWLDLSQLTKFYYVNEVTAVYRIHKSSITHQTNKIKTLRFQLSMAEMRYYYCEKYNVPIILVRKRYNHALLTYLQYDKSYIPVYPLIDPSVFQKIKYSCILNNLLVCLFKTEEYVRNKRIFVMEKCRSLLTLK